MSLPVALQLYTVRDPLAKDVPGTLRAVADIGYREVELAGFGDRSPEAYKALLDSLGLKAIGAHVDLKSLDGDPKPMLEQAKLFGYHYLTVSYLAQELQNPRGFAHAAAVLSQAAAKFAGTGVGICYHNHAFEFARLDDGSMGYDILTGKTDPSVGFELDVMWAVWGGRDPVKIMKSLAGRVPLLHIKDTKGQGKQQFVEVGTGVVDLPAVLKAAPAAGVKHLIVEQDREWIDGDPIRSAKISYDNLAPLAKTA